MNPSVESSPGMGLPEPQPVGGFASHEQAPGGGFRPEVGLPAAPETNHQPMAMPSLSVPVIPSVPLDPMTQGAQAALAAASPSSDTDDLIDKEWVVKAKQIVRATSQDPYQQNRQLAAFKADYIQKRYNKTIKLSD